MYSKQTFNMALTVVCVLAMLTGYLLHTYIVTVNPPQLTFIHQCYNFETTE